MKESAEVAAENGDGCHGWAETVDVSVCVPVIEKDARSARRGVVANYCNTRRLSPGNRH